MIVHDKGRLFLVTMPIKRGLWPLTATMWANMDEPPWRKGRGIAVRVGLDRALAFGLWGRKRDLDEDEGLLHAMTPPWHQRTAWRVGEWLPGKVLDRSRPDTA